MGARPSIVRTLLNQSEDPVAQTGSLRPVVLSYGDHDEPYAGMVGIRIETPRGPAVAHVTVTDWLRFTRLVALDQRKV